MRTFRSYPLSCCFLCCSVTKSCLTLCNPMDCSTLAPLSSSITRVCSNSCPWVSDAIEPSDPLLPPSPFASISPRIRVFSIESILRIRWPKYWSFSFSNSSSNEYSGWISFRIDWFDVLVVKTLKSLLQHHNTKSSILQCSAFFMVQISYLYTTTGKTIALNIWNFDDRVLRTTF